MIVKPIIPLLILSFGLSGCFFADSVEKEKAVAATAPQVTKTSMKTPAITKADAAKAAKCSAKGFCALPALKKRKQ